MEEDIDNETLQAQIDLSLSFAQNLVSSWVKPGKPSKNLGRAFEAELKELMRRPPRLGVGAPIPETASSSRETERLKSHLSGKGNKRPRGESDDPAPTAPSDDEDEGRGISIKKKARIDPFETKKKKKEVNRLPTPQLAPAVAEDEKPAERQPSGDAATDTPLSLGLPKRKKKKHKNRATAVDSLPEPGPSKISSHVNGEAEAPPSTPKKVTSHDVPSTEVIDISLISTPTSPISPARCVLQSTLLKAPLLNLDGPPTDDESGEEEAAANTPLSPKKKRRKRKKKKSLLSSQNIV